MVEAVSGASLEQVIESAKASLNAKTSQLTGSDNLLGKEQSQEDEKAIAQCLSEAEIGYALHNKYNLLWQKFEKTFLNLLQKILKLVLLWQLLVRKN